MTSDQAFKLGFLTYLADRGVPPADMVPYVKRAAAMLDAPTEGRREPSAGRRAALPIKQAGIGGVIGRGMGSLLQRGGAAMGRMGTNLAARAAPAAQAAAGASPGIMQRLKGMVPSAGVGAYGRGQQATQGLWDSIGNSQINPATGMNFGAKVKMAPPPPPAWFRGARSGLRPGASIPQAPPVPGGRPSVYGGNVPFSVNAPSPPPVPAGGLHPLPGWTNKSSSFKRAGIADIAGKAFDTATSAVGKLSGPALAAAAIAPPALGAAAGFGLGHLTDIDDTDVNEVRQRELIDTYKRLAEQARIKRQIKDYLGKPQATANVS